MSAVCRVAGYRNEDMPALVTVAPLAKLLHTGLEHLVGVKACVLAQQSTRQSRNQGIWRMTKDEVSGNEPRRGIDLVLAVESIEQGRADFLGSGG
jgi:hypothetical protein